MPEYQYSAIAENGDPTTGSLSASSRPDAIATLASEGKFVTEISNGPEAKKSSDQVAGPAVWSFGRGRLTLRSRAAMLQQLAVALQSGLPLLTALHVVKDQAESSAVEQLASDLGDSVEAGDALSQAMSQSEGVFSQLEISMVRVGESAGVLDQVMVYLTEFAERDLEIRQKIQSAAAYPLFVLCLAIVSVIVIVTWVLPKVLDTILENTTVDMMPFATRVLLAVSESFRSYYGLVLLAIIIAGAVAFRRWARQSEAQLLIDRFKLKLPVLGPALRKVAVARFERTLGTLTRSGIQIIEAMQIIGDTLGNRWLAKELEKVTAGISQGGSIAERLRETGQFPPLLVQVIAMGEGTGRLDELLLQTAAAYEKETAAALQRVMTILPAVFIVCLALVVTFILVAVLLPIVNMNNALPGM